MAAAFQVSDREYAYIAIQRVAMNSYEWRTRYSLLKFMSRQAA
ncbi:MAG TPA: hypothetical protein PLV52_04250 [Candidatus Omnitrophota bacterium]|nr:hypothetical protein [Candidatus Omnitrophota bacterium]